MFKVETYKTNWPDIFDVSREFETAQEAEVFLTNQLDIDARHGYSDYTYKVFARDEWREVDWERGGVKIFP